MYLFKKFILSVVVLSALAACNGGGGGDDNVAPTTADSSVEGTKQWLPVSGVFKASDPNGDPLTVTAISEGGATITPVNGIYNLSNGTLKIDGLNFKYNPLKSEATTFSYTVSDGKASSTANVKIAAAASDPLADQQWHLRNTGQKAYSLSPGLFAYLIKAKIQAGMTEADATQSVQDSFTQWEKVLVPGEDMNVLAAYAQGSTGQNTIVVVVDTGLEIAHEDLQANVLPNRSLNFISGVLDPTNPTSVAVDGDHGTSVAGLIAAVGWNGIGGRGVAPDAKLIGMNYLAEQTDLSSLLSHGAPGSGIRPNEPVAVFNRSYGATYPAALSYDELEEAIHESSAIELRSGKGAVNTKSSGNSFRSGGSTKENNLCVANGATTAGLSCYNANMQYTASTPYYFIVGAVDSGGKHSSYSTAGANLLVSAPAGEYGHTAPAMVTTDQMTCLRGYSSFPSAEYYDSIQGAGFFEANFPFNFPGHEDNSSCNYTAIFNGTSSAAPNAAGVVALILAANPNLTYRDVRHILASTSTKVDPTNATVSLNLQDGVFIAHPGWVKNKAGFEHNNLYGFGRVNAGKAVEMAKSYSANLGAFKMTEWIGRGTYGSNHTPLDLAVPDNSTAGAEISIEIVDDVVLEGAQFKFEVANPEMTFGFAEDQEPYKEYQTTAGIDLAIEVTSPSGTRSVLLSSKQALVMPAVGEDFYQGYILKDAVFLTNAFYGEKAKGTWKIKVLDANGGKYEATGGVLRTKGYLNNTVPTVVNGVAVRIFGH